MGCCVSAPAGPNDPNPANPPNLASAAQQQPNAQPSDTTQSRRRRRDPRALNLHPDAPLIRYEWTSTDRQWKRSELTRERRDFFDTRVTGRPEIWQNIHAALNALWDRTEDGLPTAQTIITAAEISVPSGKLSPGVWDTLGNYYPLPDHIVCDPTDLVEDGNGEDAEADAKGNVDTVADDSADEEEKGKGVANFRDQVKVRARLSETGKDYLVTITKNQSVKVVAKKIAQEASLASTKKIRLAYMGKILKENESLETQGWQTGHIINALVFYR